MEIESDENLSYMEIEDEENENIIEEDIEFLWINNIWIIYIGLEKFDLGGNYMKKIKNSDNSLWRELVEVLE